MFDVRIPLLPEPMLLAFQEPLNICTVTVDGDEAEGAEDTGEYGVVGIKQPGAGNDRDCGEDGTERDDAADQHAGHPDHGGAEHTPWGHGHDDARAGGDAFTAFELEPDREIVAEDGQGACQQGQMGVGAEVGRGQQKHRQHPGAEQSFEKIQQKTQQSPLFTHHTKHIGGTNVAAAFGANIDAQGAADEKSEGDRP